MFYSEALEYIKNIERSGIELGIERMRELLALLGEPDKKLRFVHVAGTNGKGSVCAFLTSILKEAGYKVGTYNSPSVFRYNERFLINGIPISDDEVALNLTEVRAAIEREQTMRTASAFNPTAFEIETAAAFLCFSANECDICVLETGLGGRWDATNVIYEKELAVITRIGLDHCAVLGNTLYEIAGEKAAIIKGAAVTCAQCDEVMRAIAERYSQLGIDSGALTNRTEKQTAQKGGNICAPKNSGLSVAHLPVPISCGLNGQKFKYEGEEYEIKLLGNNQLENAAIAICAAQRLSESGWKVGVEAVKRGLARTVWPARFEIVKNAEERFDLSVPNDKTLIFDGSHNPQGACELANNIKRYFDNKRIALVIGVLADKDVCGIAKQLCPVANEIITVTPPSARAMKAKELAEICKAYSVKHCEIVVGENIKQALQKTLNGAAEAVIMCGSFTLFAALN